MKKSTRDVVGCFEYLLPLASCGGNDEAAENNNAESTTIKVEPALPLMLKFWKRQKTPLGRTRLYPGDRGI